MPAHFNDRWNQCLEPTGAPSAPRASVTAAHTQKGHIMNQPRHSPVRQAAFLKVLRHLTDRDRDIIAVLGDHLVLTTHQITRAWFTSPERARTRLALLHHLDVLARFRFPRLTGSYPYYYFLGYTGACLNASARGEPWPKPGAVAERVTRIAGSPKLGHTLGVADFFTHLIPHAQGEGKRLTWRNEAQAAAHTGGMVKPDAHAVLTTPEASIEFYYEHDTGTEDQTRLGAKLDRYRHLAEPLPVLIELPGPIREDNLHTTLSGRSFPFPIATTHTSLTGDPAGPIWRRLHDLERVGLPALATV